MEFSFKKAQARSESSLQAASSLPGLIIEKFYSDEMRTIPQREILDRKLKELQTARLSLFLQLSKECKTRDSMILTETRPKKLEKALKKQMIKIKDIETQIDENLSEVKKAIDEAAPKIARDEHIGEDKKNYDEKKESDTDANVKPERQGKFPFRLPFPFFRRDEEDKIITENVVLYKNDTGALFKPSEKSLEAGFSSWDFEQEVLGAKINGLISGEITTYGDYCSVTVNLRIYPGGQIWGSVTEVGLLSDLMPLASAIAMNLDSKIANALPVLLEFEIEPREIARSTKITIDDIVFSLTKTDGTFDNKHIEEAGVHRLKIEAPGYEPLSFTYAFSGENHFFVHANLVPEVHGVAKIRLKKYREGVFHTYGLLQAPITEENPTATIQVNSKTVLGVFTVPKINEDDSDSSNIAFFRIPESQAFDGVSLVVNAKPFDREANIDKRRRWMYGAYTALICSLPFTFYYLGEFTAENTAYSQGRGDYDRLVELQKRSNICSAISGVFGAWAFVELVRYLWAADRVLPAKTKIDKRAMKQSEVQEFEPKLEDILEEALEVPLSETPPEDKQAEIIENNEIIVE